MRSRRRRVAQAGWAALTLLSLHPAGASESGEEHDKFGASVPGSLFERGAYEAAINGGVLFSFSSPGHGRECVNYTLSSLQLGYMLGDVKGDRWWRGNFEVLGEGFGSAIFQGDGSYIAGGTLWLRYNFVAESSWLVTYAEAGAGAVSTDISHSIVGQPFNFNLDLGAGMRCFVGRNWSINLEYRYQHISNAGTNRNNVGINADGPILGVSYFF